jgi:hypothetical protein
MRYRTNFELRTPSRTLPSGSVVRFIGSEDPSTLGGLARIVDEKGRQFSVPREGLDPIEGY